MPIEFVGLKVVVALGFAADGRPVATSNSVNLNVAVAATPQTVLAYPPALHLGPGSTGSAQG